MTFMLYIKQYLYKNIKFLITFAITVKNLYSLMLIFREIYFCDCTPAMYKRKR